MKKYLLILDRKLIRDQSTDTVKVQPIEPMSFICVTFRNMCEGLLIEAEIAQRHLNHQAHPSIDDSSQNLEAWNSMHIMPQANQCFGAISFLCFIVGMNLFQAVLLVFASSRKLGLSESDSEQFLLFIYT